MDIIQEYGLPGYKFKDTAVRHIEEGDVEEIINLFKSNYGEDYPITAFYDSEFIKRNIYSDNIIWLVLEEENQLAASGAIILNAGDYNDQIGEVGRLVVHKEMHGRNLGRRMIQALFEAADDTVEFAFGEARTFHPISQKLMQEADFRCAGYVPGKYDLGTHREDIALYSNLYGNGPAMRRRQQPTVIEPAASLANHVLTSFGLEQAQTIEASSLPLGKALTMRKLKRKDLQTLLRMRHRLTEPLVFGSLSIDQGLPIIRRKKARYEVVYAGNDVAGVLGYFYDEINGILRLNELITGDAGARAFACHYLATELAPSLKANLVVVNVSAYEPALQQTLFENNFKPLAYGPAMAFHGSERFDALKMVLYLNRKVLENTYDLKLTPEAQQVYDIVMPHI